MRAIDTSAHSVYRMIAAELAERADAESAAGHPRLARVNAELGSVYLTFITADTAHAHVIAAWCAAEKARMDLSEGMATVSAEADIARARLHLQLAALDTPTP